jgi:hypothetical protein
MPKEYDSIKKQYADKHPEWSEEKVQEVAAKVFYSIYGISVEEATELESEGEWVSWLKNHSSKELKQTNDIEIKEFVIPVDLSYKEDSEDFTIYGFVSAPTVDMYNDFIDQETLYYKFKEGPIHANYLSYHHGWMNGEELDKDPLGKRIALELKTHPTLNEPSVFCGYKLNKYHPKIKKAMYEIKEGYAGAFSIEYKTLASHNETIGDTLVRVIDDLEIVGVGLASRPVQPNAILTNYIAKSFEYKGGDDMSETKKIKKVSKKKSSEDEVVKKSKPEPKKEEKVQDEKTEPVVEKSVENVDVAEGAHPGDRIEKLAHEGKEIDTKIEELKKRLELKELELKSKELELKEIKLLKKEEEEGTVEKDFEELEGDKKVLKKVDEENIEDQEPKVEENNSENDKFQKEVIDNKELSIKDKLRKIIESDLNK